MFQINGEDWCVVVVPPDDPSLLMPDGSYAWGACHDFNRTICISAELYGEDFESVLCHELVHAAMFAHNVNLELQEEELIARIIATFGEEIIDLTDIIFDKMRRRRG